VRRNALDRDAARSPWRFASRCAVVAESRTKLWTEASDAERPLVVGKNHNLAWPCAPRRRRDPRPGAPSASGPCRPPTRLRGSSPARVAQGCVIPSLGGGLCQLSNALYDAALKARVRDRRGATAQPVIPGSLAEVGRDATVF